MSKIILNLTNAGEREALVEFLNERIKPTIKLAKPIKKTRQQYYAIYLIGDNYACRVHNYSDIDLTNKKTATCYITDIKTMIKLD